MDAPGNQPNWITNGTVVTLGEAGQVIIDGAIRVENKTIQWVGPRAQAQDITNAYDAGGGLIMPGLINAHMHCYSTFACGMALKDDPPENFVQILERLWWRLDKALTLEDVRYSALIPMARSLRHGVTTIIDHHASPNAVRGSLTAIADAARQVGLRCCLCYEVSNRDGDKIARAGIDENVEFMESCRRGDGLVTGLFGMHASMTIDDALMAACVDAARLLDTGFHIHVSESHFDPDDSLARYGKRVVHRLVDSGVAGEKSIFAHCIHVDDEEIQLLADTKTNVVHNPQSNMNNAVGRADVPRMLDAGICVGLGTDGMSAAILDDARAVNLLHKHGTTDPRVGFNEAGRLLLEGNRRVASRLFPKPVGAIAPGHAADIVVWDYHPPTPLNAANIVGHLLFGLPAAQPAMVMVDGILRLDGGVLLGVNEREIAARAQVLAEAVWERF